MYAVSSFGVLNLIYGSFLPFKFYVEESSSWTTLHFQRVFDYLSLSKSPWPYATWAYLKFARPRKLNTFTSLSSLPAIMMWLSFSLFAYVQELNYSIVPLQLIRHLSSSGNICRGWKRFGTRKWKTIVKKERLVEIVFLGNLVPYTLEVSWKDIVNHFCVLIGWARWKRKWHLCFHFKKNVLRFLFTGKFCMVMQDLTVVYSEILAELSTSNLPVVDTESFGETLERRINLCTFWLCNCQVLPLFSVFWRGIVTSHGEWFEIDR